MTDEGAKQPSGEGVGGIPLPHTSRRFAFQGFKESDLVHNFGEFVGMLSIPKVIGKIHVYKICVFIKWGMTGDGSKRPSGGGGGRGNAPPTPRSFCISEIQSKRSGAYFW